MKYLAIDKQAFAVFKAIKHLFPYLLRSHTKVIVPHTAVRALLIQKEPGDRRGNWLTTLQEYDLEIKPAKLVKGQGLCKLTVEAQDLQMEQEEGWENEVDLMQIEVLYMPTSTNSWYNDLKYYLTHGSNPNHLDAHKKISLRLKFAQYQLIDGVLFQQNYDQVLLRCLEKDDVEHILTELHDGSVGGHFSRETTAHKVLRAGYYWPTMFKDTHAHAWKFQMRQVNVGREKRPAFPLHPVTIESPFKQWGLVVLCEINLNSSKLHKYILTTIDYFSKWTEAIPLKVINDTKVI